MKKTTVYLTTAAMIGAVYVVLTMVFAPFSFGEIQVRISEALTILPVFTPAAIPGLFIGCLLGNLLGGAALPDIVFGSLATLAGAFGTWALFSKRLPLSAKDKVLAPLPPILANTLVVPFVLRYAYGVPLPIPFMMLTVGIGEVISCGMLGILLYLVVQKYGTVLFPQSAGSQI